MTIETTANPFVTIEAAGRRFVNCDLVAKALAEAWGAELGECEPGAYGMGRVLFPSGLVVYIRQDHRKFGNVSVTSGYPKLDRTLSAHERPTFPHASGSTSRGIATLAKDLKRRVVDAAAEPMAALDAKMASRADTRVALLAHMDALQAAAPGLRVSVAADLAHTHADISGQAGETYIRGTLYATGQITIERISGIPQAKALAVMAALSGEA